MSSIDSYNFDETGFQVLKNKSDKKGVDWPVVYVIEDYDHKEAYIGETVNLYSRCKQHYENPERRKLNNIHVITDGTYNKSATLDLESTLIQYIAADGSRKIQNGNSGLKNHSYFDREKYQSKIVGIWKWLQNEKIVTKEILEIENSDLFKYSPYKALTLEQSQFVENIFSDIKTNIAKTYIVNGQPGTGKTVLATYLVKYLKEHKETKHLSIALVIPVSSLRKTIKAVFRNIKGLSANMVITPSEVARGNFDLVIVDEAHRLKRRRNLGAAFGAYDQTNINLGLDREATHLDWILNKSKYQVFFYDKDQSVMPSDVEHRNFKSLNDTVTYNLSEQLRVKAGQDYINFIVDFLNLTQNDVGYGSHDLKLYENACDMVKDIKSKNSDKDIGLSRVVAGYAWPWLTNPVRNENPPLYDFEIDGCEFKWNSVAEDWVNSKNAIDEVGCIHTTQGYDLNYVGVIIGPELSYDPVNKMMVIDRTKYFDRNGYAGITDPLELERYIINIYKTLLVRGIRGTYVYIVDKHLREYFKSILLKTKDVPDKLAVQQDKLIPPIKSPYGSSVIEIPLFDSVGCGELMFADSQSEDTIQVPSWLIKPGAKYFALRTRGDSMNLFDIEDGDIILCQKNYQASSGSNAVVLIGDDATLKQIKYEKDGLLLIPKSKNPAHKIRKLTQDDEEFKVLGVFVCKLEL